MAAPGRYSRTLIGADRVLAGMAASTANTTFALTALNAGWCARFMAPDARDIKSVWINWSTVTAAGAGTLRIETIDATTGKPTGTLVDPNAVATGVVPTAGWQQVTLGSVPWASHMAAGTEYAVVWLTTTGGTNHTLRSHTAGSTGHYPCMVLTAADGTTRTNFAETGAGVPLLTFVMDDNVEETLFFNPFATVTSYNLATTAAAGMKFVVPAGCTWSVSGLEAGAVAKVGTPAGDLRGRILNSSDAAVSGTTVTADKDSLTTGLNARQLLLALPAPVTLSAGTYRLVFDSASSANTSNCWRVYGGVARASGNVPSGLIATNTADVTAGTISWTDTATEQFVGGVVIDNLPDVAAGGGTPFPVFKPLLYETDYQDLPY